jgi:paraquat-inducible protein B
MIWAIPLLSAIVGGYLVFEHIQAVGPLLTMTFGDGDGLLPDQTPVRYRGVQIGMVHSVKLSPDGQRAEVVARLNRSASGLARQGSQFWVVRPQVTAAGFHGLETIVSGSYIQVEPGHGKPETYFTGLDTAPLPDKLRGGLELILTCRHIGTLDSGAPIYHRGMEVGTVENVMLNSNATGVNIKVCIQPRYAALIRQNSVFWNAGGLDVTLKLFGVNVSAESMRSLIVGGIAFATPSPAGLPAVANSTFALQDKPEQKWLKWETPIPGWVPNGPPTNNLPGSSFPSEAGPEALNSALDQAR